MNSLLFMKMYVNISKDMDSKVEQVSNVLGIDKKELVDRAILTYIDSLSRFLDLKKEFKVWDKLSDEALLNFEKSL